jgi:hypothetical protein
MGSPAVSSTVPWRVVLILLLSLTWLSASCGDDSGSNPKIESPRETPQGLLAYYAECLENQNLAGYEACLWESYRFGFVEQDYDSAGVTPQDPYWDRTEDVQSTANMFASAQVIHIAVDLSNVVMNFAGPDTLLTGIFHPLIDVTIEGPGGEEPVVKQVRNTNLHFVLRPDPGDPDLWVIREIQEECWWQGSPRPLGVESDTFGEIKSMFK